VLNKVEIGRGIREWRKRMNVVMVRNISFIQPNLQHTIDASRLLTRSVTVKVIDMELIK
jgi:hypothetical protein